MASFNFYLLPSNSYTSLHRPPVERCLPLSLVLPVLPVCIMLMRIKCRLTRIAALVSNVSVNKGCMGLSSFDRLL
jgi:hypothetical protein